MTSGYIYQQELGLNLKNIDILKKIIINMGRRR
jgi:hypothetical protein